MPEIPRWKVDAALRLLGLDPTDAMEVRILLDTNHPVVAFDGFNTKPADLRIRPEVEDPRLHLLAMLPGENHSELVTVDADELKYFTGPKLYLDGLSTYPNGTMVLTVKRRT
jgi:hypothetical protein